MKDSLIEEIKKKLSYFNEIQLQEILTLMFDLQLREVDQLLNKLKNN